MRKLSDFKPLNTVEAYDFINKYYLPRLDTMPTKRKIFIYALNGVDFKGIFNRNKAILKREYSEDTAVKAKKINPPPPPQILFDKKFCWDSKRLLNVTIIADTAILMDNAKILRDFRAWHKKYGYGYMCISYPQYNPNTKRLILREWEENDDWCGTGRERKFYFTKTLNGWRPY